MAERRLFEDLIDTYKVAHTTQQSKTLPVSLALHMVAAILIVIVPLLSADQLPEPVTRYLDDLRGAQPSHGFVFGDRESIGSVAFEQFDEALAGR